MGAYKYYDPATQKWEITKSKSIVKSDGSLEYTPDDIKAIDDKVDGLEGDFNVHTAESMPHQFTDGTKTYRWGFRTKNGVAQFIYEEVSN